MVGRESFSSRLGFILITAGCAIGLGNVWRFPFITGAYGGAVFLVIYLFFIVFFGTPLLMMELAVGRASRRSLAGSFELLEPAGTHWHWNKFWMIFGNYVLMSFYCVVTGWMLYYCTRGFTGEFGVHTPAEVSGQTFMDMLSSPATMFNNTFAVVAAGFCVCALGMRSGVERVTKPVMLILLSLMVFMAISSAMLPGAGEGLSYYLSPDFSKLTEKGWASVFEVISAAMAQAFFTLSIGVGAVQIFGSYMSSERTIASEALTIAMLDTAVGLTAGFIIFPACFTYGVMPNQGPGLIFITLVSVFSEMEMGWLWGGLFFMFMLFAAFSTVVAVFENIIAITMELLGVARRRAVLMNFFIILFFALPCLFGYNLLSDMHPLGGSSTFLDLEDFIISNNILPLGALCYVIFVSWKRGWGFDNFLKEANTGRGIKLPRWGLLYYRAILPLVILILIIISYRQVFA